MLARRDIYIYSSAENDLIEGRVRSIVLLTLFCTINEPFHLKMPTCHSYMIPIIIAEVCFFQRVVNWQKDNRNFNCQEKYFPIIDVTTTIGFSEPVNSTQNAIVKSQPVIFKLGTVA